MLYNAKGEVPEGEHLVPLGEADVKRAGSDVTIICHSKTVSVALKAAEQLAAEGIEAEVVDLRTIRPLDTETDARLGGARPTARGRRGGLALRRASARRSWTSSSARPSTSSTRRCSGSPAPTCRCRTTSMLEKAAKVDPAKVGRRGQARPLPGD